MATRLTRWHCPDAQQPSELRKYREVELSGLEPLTSCMPVSHRHVRRRRHTLRQLRKP